MRNNITMILLPIVYVSFSPVLAQPDIAAILADSSRPAADRNRDADRMLGQVLAFGVAGGENTMPEQDNLFL